MLILAVLMFLCVGGAAAITLATGNTVVFNFDLTGTTPPPLDFVLIDPQQSFGSVGFTYFDGLNATGTTGEGPNDPIFLDGIFSFTVTVFAPGVAALDPIAQGISSGVFTEVVAADVVDTAAVPEPASLTLLGLGPRSLDWPGSCS